MHKYLNIFMGKKNPTFPLAIEILRPLSNLSLESYFGFIERRRAREGKKGEDLLPYIKLLLNWRKFYVFSKFCPPLV